MNIQRIRLVSRWWINSKRMCSIGLLEVPCYTQRHYWSNHNREEPRQTFNYSNKFIPSVITGSSILLGSFYLVYQRFNKTKVASHVNKYSAEDVLSHNSMETGIWVTFGNDVCDVTDFISKHPGGEKINLAAGKCIEPFWEIYTIHNSDTTRQLLKSMIIGKIDDTEKKKIEDIFHKDFASNPYMDEPERSDKLIVNSLKPFDAECPPLEIVGHFVTPNDMFYIRNHLPVPVIDPSKYQLTIEIKHDAGKADTLSMSLDDIKSKYEKHEVEATLQCAGNRRYEMSEYKPIHGAKAGFTAISNAVWGGIYLREIFEQAGIMYNNNNHVIFEGLDKDLNGEPFSLSISLDKVMNTAEEVLLAYEMNGTDLPADHGYPLRVIVPGVIAARSVKWLGKITVCKEESNSFWQKEDYKSSPPSASLIDYNLRASNPIYEMPVNSAICKPEDNTQVCIVDGAITAQGYAFSGGGRSILRVDVSIDGGKTWHSADLYLNDRTTYRNWSWTLWKVKLPVSSTTQKLQIMCKATDSHHNVQPESVSGIWNIRGFLNNSWHKIHIYPIISDDGVD